MTPRTGPRAAAAAAALALVLTGCGGAREGDAGDPAPSDPSSGPSSETSTSADAAPTEAESPSIAPAAGAVLEVEDLRLRAPLAFSDLPDQFTTRQTAYVPDTESAVTAYLFPNLAGFTVDESAEATLRDGPFTRGRRLADEVVDDQPVYHLAGPLERGGYGERFGTVLGDNELSVTFEFRAGEPRAYRQEVVDSVLETVDFGEESVTLPDPGTVPPPPARGPRIEVPGASLRAPVYWVRTGMPGATFDGAFRTGVLGTSIALSTAPRGDIEDLDDLGDRSVRGRGWRTPATRLDDTEVDGQPAVHVAGKVKPGTHVEQFEMLVGDQRLTLTFTFADGESKQFRDDAVARVLPTVEVAAGG